MTMWKQCFAIICTLLTCSIHPALAQSSAAPLYDEALAKSLGVNESGLRPYVLVILKTGPNKVPEGEARTKMFQGHFANMQRLAEEKKLVLAGPLDGIDGWRGVFVFATPDVEQAKAYVATDPVIINGEMVAEYHKLFSSGGLMMVNEIHKKISKK
jgi:uncharacterized protein YciI